MRAAAVDPCTQGLHDLRARQQQLAEKLGFHDVKATKTETTPTKVVLSEQKGASNGRHCPNTSVQ